MTKTRKVMEWTLIVTFETEEECDKALDASEKALRESIKNDDNQRTIRKDSSQKSFTQV